MEGVINEEELRRRGLGPDFGWGVLVPFSERNADLVLVNKGGDPARDVVGLPEAECSSGEKYLLSRNFGRGGGVYSSGYPFSACI